MHVLIDVAQLYASVSRGPGQQRGASPPAESALSASTASPSFSTLTRSRPSSCADLAVGVDGSGARDELGPGQITSGQLVDHGQAEDKTGRRAPDIGQIELDG